MKSFYKLPLVVSIPLGLLVFAISLTLVWSIYGGLYKAGGWLAVIAYIVVFGQFTNNGRTYTLINVPLVRNMVGIVVSMGAILSYWLT